MLNLPDETERAELVRLLSEIIQARGYEKFVRGSIVQPTKEYLPDEWNHDLASTVILLKRILRYSGLNLDVELHTFDRCIAIYHSDAIAWFGGIRGRTVIFGLDVNQLQDPQILIAALCHEVAHAYRHYHHLTVEGSDIEEELTDLTTIYLGFGIFTTNVADRFLKRGMVDGDVHTIEWSQTSAGYLPPESMCFLLAVQLIMRGYSGRRINEVTNWLEPNQQVLLKRSCSLALEMDKELRQMLRIPEMSIWPPAHEMEVFTSPAALDALRVTIIEHPAEDEKAPVKHNEGSPVFRVGSLNAGSLSLGSLVGALLFLSAAMITQRYSLIPVGAVVGAVLAVLRSRYTADRCSSPGCRAALSSNAVICHKCGGSIVGKITSFKQHFEEQEKYLGITDAADYSDNSEE